MKPFSEINPQKAAPPLTKAPLQEEYPLTFAEKQMIIEQILSLDSVAYNIQLAYEVTGTLSAQKLEESLNALAQLHPLSTPPIFGIPRDSRGPGKVQSHHGWGRGVPL